MVVRVIVWIVTVLLAFNIGFVFVAVKSSGDYNRRRENHERDNMDDGDI